MKHFIYSIVAILTLWGCAEDETWSAEVGLEINTLQAKDIFYDNAVLQGEYAPKQGAVSAQGFLFSQDPLTEDNYGTEYLMDEVKTGVFGKRVKDLQKKTYYYFKAFIDRPTGERVYGRQVCFMTDSIVIVPPGKPIGKIVAIDARTVSVESQASTVGNESLTAAEKKVAEIRLADCGIYYWPKDEMEENAVYYSIGEELASSYANPASKITYKLADLQPGVDYNYRLAVRMLVRFNSGKWLAYGDEVKGDVAQFQTATLELPSATTLDPMDVTPTSFTAYGLLDDNGKDPQVRYGIEYGTNAEQMENSLYADNVSTGMIRTYSLFIQNLTPSTTYYFRAFAENEAGRASSNTVKSFKTADPSAPVVGDYPYNYDFRVTHFTTSSVWLRAKLLSDGGSPITSKGFYWGTTPDAVTQKVEVSAELALEGVYQAFNTELTAVNNSIVYYKPYAVNDKGEFVSEVIYEARTAINGGKLFCFDPTKRLTPTCNNMVESNTEVIYYELDPIRTNTAVYYMLDRNLGATRPHDLTTYNKSFVDAATYPEIFDAAGYYYQFDRPIPSATPDMKITGVLDSSPYYWTATISFFSNPAMNEVGPTWDQKVCPEGYDLPTDVEMDDIITTICPVEADRTMANLFEATRFGVTGSRTKANGNLLNNTDPKTCEIWLKGPHPAKADAKTMKIAAPPTGKVSYPNANRYSGRPVRCIRKEVIN